MTGSEKCKHYRRAETPHDILFTFFLAEVRHDILAKQIVNTLMGNNRVVNSTSILCVTVVNVNIMMTLLFM